MDTQTLVDNLIKSMNRHDWFYEYNDDFRGWSKSNEQYKNIWSNFEALQKVDEALAVQTWNSMSPERWRK